MHRYLLGGEVLGATKFFYQHIVVTISAVGEKDTNVKNKDTYMLDTRVSYCGIYCTCRLP